MKKAILFDLDATLVQFDQKKFEYGYFSDITKRVAALGFNPQEFMENLTNSVKVMYKNDGTKTNQEAFENYMISIYGEADFKKINDEFVEYYHNEYNNLSSLVTKTPEVKKIIDWCKQNFEYVILATNPFFPTFAVQYRLDWTGAGLKLTDFDLVTTYETAHYSKPNPQYFAEVLSKFNLKPSECIMVGNNELEDYITATKFGIDAFLVGDHVMPYAEAETHPEVIKLENLIEVLKVAKQK